MKGRVVIGLSGGVDSAVAAHVLMQEGYDVVAIFMRNWHDESVTINNECPWIDDSNDAMIAAEHLGIPFQVLDMSTEYKKRIVDYMFREYEAGRTPNPDVLCNREVKFDLFLKAAVSLKADHVGTGHYARIENESINGELVHKLIAAVDKNKDQSYFLCQLSQQQLSMALFPIGGMTKPEVRAYAQRIGLPNADKKDSQGLCFIGKVKLPTFLQQQLKPKKGKIVQLTSGTEYFERSRWNGSDDDIELARISESHNIDEASGVVAGEHEGAHYYTIGQRRGLGVGGHVEPLFVAATDTDQNIIYVVEGENHPALFREALFIKALDVHWLHNGRRLSVGDRIKLQARIRYRQPLVACTLVMKDQGLYLIFDEPQRSIAAGQFAAWYDGEELLGSGVIN
ncbi:MAG: tRNA 2-thiouridine(34) synthase MnmA [Flavobacteriales bacterium]